MDAVSSALDKTFSVSLLSGENKQAIISALVAVDGIPDQDIPKVAALRVLCDMLCERAILRMDLVKRRRGGKRGTKCAQNYLTRKALWFAREYFRKCSTAAMREELLIQSRKVSSSS